MEKIFLLFLVNFLYTIATTIRGGNMKNLKFIVILFIALLTFSYQNLIFAEQFVFENIDYNKSDSMRVISDGKEVQFDVKPQIVNSRTLVPVRAFFEAVNLTVEWDNTTQTVSGYNNDNSNLIKFVIGSNKAIINNQEYSLDVPASIIGSRTMVPLRFISEGMGYKVVYIGDSNLILISKNDIIEWRFGGYETDGAIKKFEDMYVNGEKTSEKRYIIEYPDNVIALVNGKQVTQEVYDIFAALDIQSYLWQGLDPDQPEISDMFVDEEDVILNKVIENFVLLDAAEKQGSNLSEKEYEEELEKSLFYNIYIYDDQEFFKANKHIEKYLIDTAGEDVLINEYVSSKIWSNVPKDDELKKLIEERKLGQYVMVNHILVETEEEAKSVLERLNNGEDFFLLAMELSQDTLSKDNGGSLFFIGYDFLPKPFVDAAFSMEIGSISEPVKTEYGYHIIEVEDTYYEPITLENSKEYLIDVYNDDRYDELIKGLINEAEIIIKK
jgi:foldase protein PrsA